MRSASGAPGLLLLACVAGFLGLASAGWAVSAQKDKDSGEAGLEQQSDITKVVADVALPTDQRSVTEHVVETDWGPIRYTATAGALPVQVGDEDELECRVFFIAYDRPDEDPRSRPLTFLFNGGPGAASVYLHLGAVGPRRAALDENDRLAGPRARLSDNAETWLHFTDLVFVDPAGTGYSRCLNGRSSRAKRDGGELQTWGVREDLHVLAKFIRLYLTRHERWGSPKFLSGESYGGTRVAGLADLLQRDYGIALHGIVLISPALEFSMLRGDRYALLPWIVPVPSYAATARYHGVAPGQAPAGQDVRSALQGVESFTVNRLLPALVQPDAKTVSDELAIKIGLPKEKVELFEARVPLNVYVKELLGARGRLISVYDGSRSASDPNPGAMYATGGDFLLVRLNTILTAAFNAYAREELEFTTDIPYEVLNRAVAKKWNWRSGLNGDQGFVGVAENLKNGMTLNEAMQVLVVHGVFDLVTPYFASVAVIRQMGLSQALKSNLRLNVYEGGHMFYISGTERRRLFEDVSLFYESALQER